MEFTIMHFIIYTCRKWDQTPTLHVKMSSMEKAYMIQSQFNSKLSGTRLLLDYFWICFSYASLWYLRCKINSISYHLGNLDVLPVLCFRLLLHHLASTAFGQRPHPLPRAPPTTWVSTLISMMSRSLLTTPSYPAWTYTYATTVLQWMKVRWK